MTNLEMQKSGRWYWQLQQPIQSRQLNPVSGTLYPMGAITEPTRLHYAMAMVIWTVQPSPLEMHPVVTGMTTANLDCAFTNPVSATAYYLRINTVTLSDDVFQITSTDPTVYRSIFVELPDFSCSAEITGGTVSDLRWKIQYSVLRKA